MRVFYSMVLSMCVATCFAEAPCGLPGDQGTCEVPCPRPPFEIGKRMSPHCRPIGWIVRTVTSEQFIESGGLSSNQVLTIKEEVRKITELNQSLETNIHAVTRKQAYAYRNILQDKKSDPAPLYACAEQIAVLRGEQAKLSIRLLLHVRETLNEEQFRRLDILLREEGRKRHMERLNLRNRRESSEKGESVPCHRQASRPRSARECRCG